MRLCVDDDWAEDHHDIEVMDEAGTVLDFEGPQGNPPPGRLADGPAPAITPAGITPPQRPVPRAAHTPQAASGRDRLQL